MQREHSAQGYGDAEPDVACAEGGRKDVNKHTCQDGDGAPIAPAAVRAEPQQGHGERGRERSELEALWPCVRAETGQAGIMPRARASCRRRPVESPRAPGSVVPTGSFGNDLKPWNK